MLTSAVNMERHKSPPPPSPRRAIVAEGLVRLTSIVVQDLCAIDALKIYAQQNRDPPPEVLDALRGRWIWRAGRTARTVAENVAGGVASGVAAGVRGDDKWDRRFDRWERRMDIRIASEPLRRWNWPIFTGSVTLGFGLAWQYAHANNDTFLIIAIIAGALTVAGVLSAMVATFWRIP